MTSLARSIILVAALSVNLAGCQSTGSRLVPEPESSAIAARLHPTIRRSFDDDYIKLIVKGTSAEAMARSCARQVRVKPEFRHSLTIVLRTNDIEFGRGTSRREVAQKIAEHVQQVDCNSLASRLNAGGYDNIFLERI